MLDFRIETFLTVCRTMNFTKAAQELNITQPAVSHHIRYLEEDYDARFFAYQGKRLTLTRAGREFLNAAATMKHDELALRGRIRGLDTEKSRLRFGATLTVGEAALSASLGRFLRSHPGIRMEMRVEDTRELLGLLDEGKIEFAIVEGYFPNHEYDSLPFSRESYIAVCAPGYRFMQPVRRVADFVGERLLLREPGSGTREVLERYLRSQNLSLEDFSCISEISSLQAIKALVREGCGVTFLYEAAVHKELKENSLQKIALEDFDLWHDFSFIWRKNSIFSEGYREIYHQLRKE